MDTMSLSSRARTSAKFAAAGISALVATFAVAGSAGANVGTTDPPRIEVMSGVTCNADGTPGWLEVFYDDLVDGHVPQSAHEELREGSTVVWSADGLYQENGNYFNARTFSSFGPTLNPGATFNPDATYTYAVTITYDDQVTQTQSTTIDLSTTCAAAPSTTSPPPTTAPPPDRFGLIKGHHGCANEGGEAFVEWTFLDVPDGHLPSGYQAELSEAGVLIESTGWIDLAGTDGDDRTFQAPTDFRDVGALKATSYTLTVTINYHDGVNEKHIETFDLARLCDGRVNGASASAAGSTPSTTTPTGTLPETGSGDATWILGAIAGLFTTAGAALFAVARRRRID